MAIRGTVAGFLKGFLFLYALGLVLALQATSLMEFFFSVTIPWPIRTFSVGAVIPLLFVYLGRRLFPQPQPRLPFRFWGVNALLMFGFWAGGYFLVGAATNAISYHSLAIALDALIPFEPDWVFIYLTVYAFFLIPLFYIDDRNELLIFDASQVLALCISYTFFIVYPVAIDRPPVVAQDFATWALSLVQAQDPSWNCFPSTHCTTCTVAALSVLRVNKRLAWWAIPSTLAICVSTVMTKQHFVLDVIAGVCLGVTIHFLVAFVVERTPWGKRVATRLVGTSRPLTGEV